MARERLYSSAWEANVKALQQGDPVAVDASIDFLDADPICFRSGYAKEKLCRFLSRIDLAEVQQTRLVPIVAKALGSQRPVREQKQWRQLAMPSVSLYVIPSGVQGALLSSPPDMRRCGIHC
jgi:hypothetical protein